MDFFAAASIAGCVSLALFGMHRWIQYQSAENIRGLIAYSFRACKDSEELGILYNSFHSGARTKFYKKIINEEYKKITENSTNA